MTAPVLSVNNLRVSFGLTEGQVQAVEQVSFDIAEGETVGLVGESGSGKSVTAHAILGLIPSPPGRIESGEVRYDGQNLVLLPPRAMRRLRGKELAIIFQDPMSSLNPFLTVGRQVTEMFEVHAALSKRDARGAAARALGDVGIAAPEERLAQFPHELSGGLRQRVMIGMALALNPRVLVADEPTTALDVTVQAQVLELLERLQETHGTAILLISHDLGVVASCADRVHVMYSGRLVESAPAVPLFERPLHPYTRGLLRSLPRLGHDPEEPLPTIQGAPPDPLEEADGCAFTPRCELAVDRCRRLRPPFEAVPSGDVESQLPLLGRFSACFEVATLRDEAEPEPTP